ncbi:MAG TPA: alpha/beta fold hydrolase [Vicinamibacterales bacterium]|nr:alpha/beta fold hydrolase [Vicinamibacterales bacterium]
MAATFSRRTRGVALAVGAILTFLVLAGVTYQSVATALERHQFPHPGRLIDVGGHQLHLHCVGDGSPVVVLESAAAGMSAGWGSVQSDLGKTTRVCSYDRAGLGWSEAGDGDYEPSRVPDELKTLLEHAHERGPFIIVGHELGATFARLYAARFPRETAALVLIDDPSENMPPTRSGMVRAVGAWPWLARIGLLRATRSLSRHAAGLPDGSRHATRVFLNRPDHLTRAALEISRLREAATLATADPVDPKLRVIRVTTSAKAPPAFIASTDEARSVTRAVEEAVARVRR